MNDHRRLRVLATLVSLSAFLVSLMLPAIHAGNIAIHGSQLLFMGWMGIVVSGVFAWMANPLYALAVLLFVFRQDRWAPWVALAAFLIGLDSLRLDTWRVDEKPMPIDHFGAAFYVWEASMLILAVGAFVVATMCEKARRNVASG